MNKRQEKEQNLNIINPKVYEEKKIINKRLWITPLIVMIFVGIIMMTVVTINVYENEKKNLELETFTINDSLNNEFSIALNSINLNGYIEIFEQYMKTVDSDATSSIYYDTAVKTLDNVTNISNNIVTTFMVSYENKSFVASGMEEVLYDYQYDKQVWYDYKKITQDELYVSNNFKLDKICDEELFAIIRPVLDTMNDKPLGLVAFCYKESYLDKVFKKAVNDNIEGVIYTDTGKIILNTMNSKNITMLETTKEDTKYVKTQKTNENLNWIVETYVHKSKIVLNSLIQLALVIVLFIFLIYTYMKLIANMKNIKVIDVREKLINIEKEEPKDIIKKEVQLEEELAIEDVLSDKELDTSYSDNEVIIAGEIIFDKKK